MSKNSAKFWIFVCSLLVLIPLALIGFGAFSSFIAAFNTGADPASIFRGHTLYLPTAEEAQWISTAAEGTEPTRSELEELISAYWRAWDALGRASYTGDLQDLPTYWAGAALTQAREAVTDRTRLTYAGHRLYLTFFSDDSSIAAIRDEGFSVNIESSTGAYTLTATAACILTLDNGFWRIRQCNVDYS